MNKFLRTAPMRRVLAVIAGAVLAIGGGTAIALAATNNSPHPPKKRLAAAIHQAMVAKPVTGISADINFTNNLIPSFELQGTDPLLTGGSGHIWVSNTGELRLELYNNNNGPGDPEIVINHNSWWIYDPTLNTVYRGRIPAPQGSKKKTKHALPTVAQIQADLNNLAKHLSLSSATPTDTGGKPTYTVRISPKHSAGLLGELQLGWDAYRGVPLQFAIYRNGNTKQPVLGLTATSVTYGKINPSVFNSLRLPRGPRVVTVATPASSPPGSSTTTGNKAKKHTAITGLKAVGSHISFTLAAPAALAGLPRQSVSLLDMGKQHGALVTYGQNLGGIAVIEEPATPNNQQKINLTSGSGHHTNGITLPSVTIRFPSGQQVSGQELDTALGTIIRFTRGNVTYTVMASLLPQVAKTAAQGL